MTKVTAAIALVAFGSVPGARAMIDKIIGGSQPDETTGLTLSVNMTSTGTTLAPKTKPVEPNTKDLRGFSMQNRLPEIAELRRITKKAEDSDSEDEVIRVTSPEIKPSLARVQSNVNVKAAQGAIQGNVENTEDLESQKKPSSIVVQGYAGPLTINIKPQDDGLKSPSQISKNVKANVPPQSEKTVVVQGYKGPLTINIKPQDDGLKSPSQISKQEEMKPEELNESLLVEEQKESLPMHEDVAVGQNSMVQSLADLGSSAYNTLSRTLSGGLPTYDDLSKAVSKCLRKGARQADLSDNPLSQPSFETLKDRFMPVKSDEEA